MLVGGAPVCHWAQEFGSGAHTNQMPCAEHARRHAVRIARRARAACEWDSSREQPQVAYGGGTRSGVLRRGVITGMLTFLNKSFMVTHAAAEGGGSWGG